MEHLAGLDVRRLPGPSDGIETIVHPLVRGDLEQFTTWRATDDYLAEFVRKETQEHWDGKRVLFVAEASGHIVGTVQFVPTHADNDLADGKTTAYLQALEVKEDFRNRGLGTWLMTSVERMAAERGFRRLTLMVEPDNHPALSLYRKQGFAFFKDLTEVWRGKPHYLLCMEKRLSGAWLSRSG
ncbi:MAG: N-acetyltransferase family protein [Bacillota bacterium]